jgi:hypothetical protein
MVVQVREIEENADNLTYLANWYDNELIERIDKWNFENPGLNIGLENLTARMNITLAHQLANKWKIEDAKQIKKWVNEDAEVANKRKKEDAEILAAQFNKILEIQATRMERLKPLPWDDELFEKVIAFERDVISPLQDPDAAKSINKGYTFQPEQRHRRELLSSELSHQPEKRQKRDTEGTEDLEEVEEKLIQLTDKFVKHTNKLAIRFDNRLTELAKQWKIEDVDLANNKKNDGMEFGKRVENLAVLLNTTLKHQATLMERLVTDALDKKWRIEDAEFDKLYYNETARLKMEAKKSGSSDEYDRIRRQIRTNKTNCNFIF